MLWAPDKKVLFMDVKMSVTKSDKRLSCFSVSNVVAEDHGSLKGTVPLSRLDGSEPAAMTPGFTMIALSQTE